MKWAWYPHWYYLHSYFIYSATISGRKKVSYFWHKAIKYFLVGQKHPISTTAKPVQSLLLTHNASAQFAPARSNTAVPVFSPAPGRSSAAFTTQASARRKASEYREHHEHRWVTCCQSAWLFHDQVCFSWFGMHDMNWESLIHANVFKFFSQRVQRQMRAFCGLNHFCNCWKLF